MKKRKILSAILTIIILSLCFALVASASTATQGEEGTDDTITPYGTITSEFADKEQFPFAVFDTQGNFIKAYEKLYGPGKGDNSAFHKLTYTHFTNKSWSEENGWSGGTTELVLYLRRDYTLDSDEFFANIAHIQGNLTFDLGTHSLNQTTASWKPIFDLCVKGNSNTLGDKEAPTHMTVKNGSINMYSAQAIKLSCYNSTGNVDKKLFNVTFENIKFGLQQNANLNHYMLTTVAPSSSNYEYKTGTINLTFNDCIYDLMTNYNNKCNEIFRNTPAADRYIKCNVTVNGGTVLTKNASTLLYTQNTDISGSTVVFGKTENGNYTSMVVHSSTQVPSATALNQNGGTLAFVKISEQDNTTTYRLRPQDLSAVSFTPKMSVTLANNLIVNLYIPNDELIQNVYVSSTLQNLEKLEKKNINNQEYFLIKVPLAAAEAAKDIVVTAELALSGNTAIGTFTFSIIKYASKILDSDVSATEKTLIKDILSYVKSAYAFFDIEDVAAVSARIDNVLNGYEGALKVEGSTENPKEDIDSATFVLSSAPAIRFYLPENKNQTAYEFFIDGKKITNSTYVDLETERYIELTLFAYQFCDDIYYSVDGVLKGSYHIASYYNWATNQNNSKLVDVVEKFWIYCQSALKYKLLFTSNKNEYIPEAQIVNKNGADATVSYVIDDGNWATARFAKSMIETYGNLAFSFAIPAKQFVSLNTEDSDGDGIPEYVMVDGKYTYETNESSIKFWNDILVSKRTEIVSHTYTHGFWGTNDDGGRFEYVKNGEYVATLSELFPKGSSTKEIYASKQII